MLNLKEVIVKYPECLDSAAKFRSYLLDLYPDPADGARIKVLADILSCGVVDEIKKGNSDAVSLARYNKIVEEKYGYSPRLIKESIFCWTEAFHIDQHPCPVDVKPLDDDEESFDIGKEKHIHVFTDTVVPSTCRERGYTLHQCACGYAHKDNYTATGEHSFELVDTIPSTCCEEGREDYLCSVCGEYQSKSIPQKPHIFGNWVVSKAATCDCNGVKERRCKKCAITETESIPALTHTWSDWTIQEFATCTEDGKDVRQCTRCGKVEERIIPATGHAFSDWMPSESQEGMFERFCRNCGIQELMAEEKLLLEKEKQKKQEQITFLENKYKELSGKFTMRRIVVIIIACLGFISLSAWWGYFLLTNFVEYGGLGLFTDLGVLGVEALFGWLAVLSGKEFLNICRNKKQLQDTRKDLRFLKKTMHDDA